MTHTTGAAEAHPTPQFRRDAWSDLCGTWQFAHDDDGVGRDARWHDGGGDFGRTITVPYPPESEASGLRETGFHPVVWYRRTFDAPAHAEGERVLLHFGAVDYRADVWVNGHLVATHEGGHTPFAADITAALDGSGEQTVVVRAEDQPQDVRFPRGKQDWLEDPHTIWYYRTTGIWQPVWLEVVPRLHITDLHWTPDLPNGRLQCGIRLSGVPRAAARVNVTLRRGDTVLAEQTVRIEEAEMSFDIAIPALEHGTYRDHLYWTPERPTLIDARVELTVEEGTGDVVDSYAGLRSCEAAEGHFLLNGLPYYLRMVLGQNYWPKSHLAASAEELRREVELIKALGFNGVRIHQKVEDPRFLYWCDRLGLAVWGEMPSAYAYSSSAVEKFTSEWLEVVRRDRSHPSIITWVPLNESWGVTNIAQRPDQAHFASALYHLTKALDTSRPVISNDGWELVESDIWSVHDYAPDGEGLTARFGTAEDIETMLAGMGPARRRIILGDRPRTGQPVMLTEFGGLSYTPKTGEAWHGYATVDDAETFQSRLEGLFDAILASPHVAGFCYTQMTDTEQETNGLLTAEREAKLPVEVIRDIITRPAASVPYELINRARDKAKAASEGSAD